MSNVESTELKLKTTPTGGLDASHSPYYRRLLSAGYKGYLQGTIGGASLYGTLGLIIGGLVAVPLLFTPVGWAALALIPAAAGVGVVKGASTFGNIGSVAAINAESADLAEQRRYLLDRYHDLPEGVEGDREAAEIRKELIRRQENNSTPPHLFHWKTVAVCAALGAAVALALLCTPMGAAILGETAITHVFSAIGINLATSSVATGVAPIALTGSLMSAGVLTAVGTAVGTGLGALAGAVFGLDRYYVRKWFDVTENIVHASPRTDIDPALNERSELVSRLQEAAKQDEITKNILTKQHAAANARAYMRSEPVASTVSAPPERLAIAEPTSPKPGTRISQATMQKRMAQLQQAIDASL